MDSLRWLLTAIALSSVTHLQLAAQDREVLTLLAGGIIASVIWDIKDAGASARDYNRREQGLSIRPSLNPSRRQMGLSVNIPFPGTGVRRRHFTSPDRWSSRDPQTASLLSVGGTALGILTGSALLSGTPTSRDREKAGGVMVATGILIGPAIGHLYSHNVNRALGGVGLRALMGAVGFGVLLSASDDE